MGLPRLFRELEGEFHILQKREKALGPTVKELTQLTSISKYYIIEGIFSLVTTYLAGFFPSKKKKQVSVDQWI